MSERQYETLESCLEAIASGVDCEQIIAQHPELQPALKAALQAQAIHNKTIPFDLQQRSRSRVLAHAASLRTSQPTSGNIFARLPRLGVAILLALIAFLTWSSLMIASARSLPGDQLYPVKRAIEDLRINLSSSPDSQQHTEEQYRQRRIEEVQRLIDQQRVEMVSFDGIVNEQGVRHWDIGGIMVIVAPETNILGQIDLGTLVEVEGITQAEGWVRASEIHLREFEISGIVESISTHEWVISGKQIPIIPETHIDSNIQIGSQVQVVVHTDDDGNQYAVKIIFVSAPVTATPSPAPTASPFPTISSTSDDHEEVEDHDDNSTEQERDGDAEDQGESEDDEEEASSEETEKSDDEKDDEETESESSDDSEDEGD